MEKQKTRNFIPLNDACCTPVSVEVDTQEVASTVKVFAALADPTRLQIVQMLSKLDEPLCVCDILSNFELGQPTISHHLKVLREAKLVQSEKRGLWVYYSLNRETVAGLGAFLEQLSAAPATLIGSFGR